MQSNTADLLDSSLSPANLQRGEIFGALGTDAIDFLLHEGELVQVAAGERVFETGDPGEHFFIVCDGSVDFFR